MTRRRYAKPQWPSEPFFLESVSEGWTLGPFAPDAWGTSEDGTVFWADGYTHPVVLRVRDQEGELLHANDGDVREMTYRVVPVSKAPESWLGGG
jgi:hypothetical protein